MLDSVTVGVQKAWSPQIQCFQMNTCIPSTLRRFDHPVPAAVPPRLGPHALLFPAEEIRWKRRALHPYAIIGMLFYTIFKVRQKCVFLKSHIVYRRKIKNITKLTKENTPILPTA